MPPSAISEITAQDLLTLGVIDRIVPATTPADLDAVEARVRREGYSRYPLSENNDPDRIVGYLYAKDLWAGPRPSKGGLAGLRRDILFVPPSMPVVDLLVKMQ